MPLRLICLILLFIFAGSCAATLDLRVELREPAIAQGGVAPFRLSGGARGEALSVSFTGGEVYVIEEGEGGWGILAVDLEAAPGSYELEVGRGARVLRLPVEVTDGGYPTERLRLPPDMVDLDEKTLERVGAEAERLSRVWTASAPGPLFTGPFIMPAEGRTSGRFGTRRILNGRPRSPHSGVDIAAPAGTPVLAANTGRVVFVGDFFFKGNFVVIDHGFGLFTEYSHLSQVKVGPGEQVTVGDVIGNIGATGRATGPHLHFAVKIGDARVSPERVFEVTERLIPSLYGEASGRGAGKELPPRL